MQIQDKTAKQLHDKFYSQCKLAEPQSAFSPQDITNWTPQMVRAFKTASGFKNEIARPKAKKKIAHKMSLRKVYDRQGVSYF